MSRDADPPGQKDQHYIPKFYLKGFTDKQGVLWVYEKFKPRRASKPKNEACNPDYYTHVERGWRDESAEDTLKVSESRVAPVIRKLASPQFSPSPQQMGYVYLFIALMFVRVPSWRRNLDQLFGQIMRERTIECAKDKAAFYKSCEDLERDTGVPLNINYESLRQHALNGEYQVVQTSTAFNLDSMFQSAITVAEQLRECAYEILHAPSGNSFLTSDSPIFTMQPDGNGQATIGMGFAWPKVVTYFPLNKRACLRLKKGSETANIEISADELDQINKVTMANAGKYVFSAESYRKTARLFDQWGCKIQPGKNAFMIQQNSAVQNWTLI